jgi:hypothetical protein
MHAGIEWFGRNRNFLVAVRSVWGLGESQNFAAVNEQPRGGTGADQDAGG